MNNAFQSLNIQFAPMLDLPYLIALSIVASLFALAPIIRGKNPHLWIWRSLAAIALLATLANPQIIQQQRQPLSDVALIILDRSPSQNIADRTSNADRIERDLKDKLAKIKNLEVRTASIGAPADSETRVFDKIEQHFADIPKSRRAGVFLITDGQIHDIPSQARSRSIIDKFGPVHTLLDGTKDEIDRSIKFIKAPTYGIIGDNISVTFRIDNARTDNTGDRTTVNVRMNENIAYDLTVQTGEPQTLSFPIEHAGQNVLSLSVPTIDGELTARNNQTAIIINGLRDRLKVLLVSGKPHMGERTWRNLLTSDPGIDLVHFTILRDRTKQSPIPQHELSLIPFPTRELFEVKLYDFDLIIFDRYKVKNIMPKHYFTNIAKYVIKGGALLVTSGPDFSGQNSIMTTSLGKIIPGIPTGNDTAASYRPELTQNGLRHPVTAKLHQTWDGEWGPWLWQTDVTATKGHTLMSGHNNNPLLILDRVGDGRIAQISSDQIWLWSQGYQGGGPQGELLRRLSHWLMKEPDLEEDALKLIPKHNKLTIERRNFNDNVDEASISFPDGSTKVLKLKQSDEENNYTLSTTVAAHQQGIYRVSDAAQTRIAIIGQTHTPENTALITTDEHILQFSDTTKSGVFWPLEDSIPTIKHLDRLNENSKLSGKNWLALKRNNDYNISKTTQFPLLPSWLSLILLLSIITWGWWRESR